MTIRDRSLVRRGAWRGLVVVVASTLAAPAMAQNPPAGRELPTVCVAGACNGGVSQWAAPGAGAPSLSVNGTRMTIRQQRQRELFNWATFDVASGHSVEFDQAFGASALALNRVLGTTNPKSFINGAVKAPGEVYVINQNGILFGARAQVDVHSLTASSLALWDDLEFLSDGITGAIAKTDPASGAPLPEAAFDQTDGVGGIVPAGEINVESGARIRSADGGRIMLVAPKVTNAGTIESPGGQTILAGAYDKVYVAASTDPNLRGLVVEVDTGGEATNLGTLVAERGNVSMVGLAVNQQGTARATTALNFNGSIRLSARHKTSPANVRNVGGQISILSESLQTTPDPGDPEQDFGVRIGPRSVTEVLIENSDEQAIDASPQARSNITATGKTITVERDARITARGGDVALTAVSGDDIPGVVSVATGAVIDVSGTDDTVLPVADNVAALELRGNELADFPQQRNGALRGQTVLFDRRKLAFVENSATTADDDQYFLPIANVTAAVTSQRRGLSERLADGGSVTIRGDSVAIAAGATIDFSGGLVTYEPGFLQTSLLLSEGRVFDIHSADPNLDYDAVLPFIDVDHARWGVTQTFGVFGPAFAVGRFEAGYAVGHDAGSLSIIGGDIELGGTLIGGIHRGRLQRLPPGARLPGRVRSQDEIPLAGLLNIGELTVIGNVTQITGPDGVRLGASTVDDDDLALAIDAAMLNDAGINRLAVVSSGAVRLGDFSLADGGSLSARALAESLIDGRVRMAGGHVELETLDLTGTRPALSMTGNAAIDVSGLWVNDSELLNPDGAETPLYVHAGNVTLTARGDLSILPGALIDVSAGARFDVDGELQFGRSGAITLSSTPIASETISTRVALDGDLRGYGFTSGGTLTINAGAFVIGNSSNDVTVPRLALSPAFFSTGGFTSINLNASSILDGFDQTLVEFAAGSDNTFRAMSLNLAGDFRDTPSGTPLSDITGVDLLPLEQRPATHLTVRTSRSEFDRPNAHASIVVDHGARLSVETGGSVSLNAPDRIVLAGELHAPGGDISVTLRDVGGNNGFSNEGIWLLDGGHLDARGADLTFVNEDGLRTGDILQGGTVELVAARGAVVIAPGATIDVSGASGVIDLPRTAVPGATPTIDALTVNSAAGRVHLAASETLLPFGSLRGAAGGPGSAGGTLELALALGNRAGNSTFGGNPQDVFPEDPRLLLLGATPAWRTAWAAFDDPLFDTVLRTSASVDNGVLAEIDLDRGVHGLGFLDPATILAGGFDALSLTARQNNSARTNPTLTFARLPAEIRLSGNVSLTLPRALSFDAPVMSSDGGTALLRAPYVALGSTNQSFRVAPVDRRNLFDPLSGSGRLTVSANHIDLVGFSSLQGFGYGGSVGGAAPVQLVAAGDIRLHGLAVPELRARQSRLAAIQGAFETATDLSLRAAQVYPTTFSDFELAVRADGGSLRIAGNGGDAVPPLSAGGHVRLTANHIDLSGVLRAPLGQLTINAALTDATAVQTAIGAATVAAPFNPANVVQALPALTNTGRGAVTGVVSNQSLLRDTDYRLTYTGNRRYTLTRLSDNTVQNIDTGTSEAFTAISADGFRIVIRDTARAIGGDSYLVRHGTDPLIGVANLAAGSLTSVSGNDLTIPFGKILLGNNWTFNINGVQRTLDEPRIFESAPTPEQLAARPFNAPDRPWTKGITINGDTVRLNPGAELDLSGGGDLIASEFTPGPGGTRDLFNAGVGAAAFALVPDLALGLSPRDPLLDFDAGSAASFAAELPDLSIGNLNLEVTIGAGSDIPAGTYTLLPRGYALLPGAFLVEPVSTLNDYAAPLGATGLDGVPVVSARFGIAATGIIQQRPIGLRVETREQVLERAEYTVLTANDFFSTRAAARDAIAPQLPTDGGQLVVEARNALRLGGSLTPNTGNGRSIQVDVLGDHLAVVNRAGNAPGIIELLASDLNGLGAESLLLGGRRTFAEDALKLDLAANRVSVAADVVLEVPELILGALTDVTVNGDVRATGEIRGVPALRFATNSDNSVRPRALVRVSADQQVTLSGTGAPGGIVTIGADADLFASGSITLDGSSDAVIDGHLRAPGGSISLNTSRISLGSVPAATSGLVLATLDALDAAELRLRSATTIDIYGALAATATPLTTLTLDAAALRGFGNGNALLSAAELVVGNSAAPALHDAGGGNGTLTLTADRLRLTGGAVDLSGFSRSTLRAADVTASGETTLSSDTALDIIADTLGVSGAGRLDIDVAGTLRVLPNGQAPQIYAAGGNSKIAAAPIAPGGILTLLADTISLGTYVHAPSGQVSARARSGDVTLTAGAAIDVAGISRLFDIREFATSGGGILLGTSTGDVVISNDAHLDIAGVALTDGGFTAAGELTLDIPQAQLRLPIDAVHAGLWRNDGDSLSRVMPVSAAAGARLTVDARALGALDVDALGAAGFVRGQSYRQRDGDVTLAADRTLRAHEVDLAVDRGALTLNGVIDASADMGGRVRLFARGDVTVNGSIDAAALGTGGRGGEIELSSTAGRVRFNAAASLDVAGRDADGNRIDDGLIRFTAPRAADNSNVAIDPLTGTIDGAARVEVVANRVYSGIARIEALDVAADASQIGLDRLLADNTTFVGPGLAAALDPGAVLGDALHVLPGIEIRSAAGGNLTLATPWALNTWRNGGEPGLLTLRAAGDLIINADLNDGITQRDNVDLEVGLQFGAANKLPKVDQLLDSASWTYRLVGGADLASTLGGSTAVAAADATAVTSVGDIRLLDGIRIRTGSGAISLAAGRDLVYLDTNPGIAGAAIYTTGLHTGFGQLSLDEADLDHATLAGLVSLFRDFLGFDYGLAIPDASVDAIKQAPWFFDAYIPGVGFGADGGDIRIDVRGDVHGPGSTQMTTDWLVVMGGPTSDPELGQGAAELPTFWTVRYDKFRQNLGTLGGGDVTINAGGDIDNLSVMLPTTGRPDSPQFSFLSSSRFFVTAGENNVTVLGGGDLDMRAGGDINGARVMLGRGHGQIQAGGDISAVSGSTLDAVFILGDSQLDVTAGGDLTVETIANFSMLRRPLEFRHRPLTFLGAPSIAPLPLTSDTRSYFFTYGTDSSLGLTSLAADVTLQNANQPADPIFSQFLGNPSVTEQTALLIYPDDFSARSFSGSVLLRRGFRLFPDGDGSLELLAAQDISDLGFTEGTDLVTLVQSDADASLLPGIATPSNGVPVLGETFEPSKNRPLTEAQRAWHAPVPVHTGDTTPSLLVTLNGTIGQARAESRGLRLFLAEPGRIVAGADILNLDFEIQHSDGTNGSLVRAGRDFRFTPSRDLAGNFAQSITSQQGALFSGPGNAVVMAGRDVELGTSDGIVTIGNLRNFALPEHGADLSVLAGVGAGPDLANFLRLFIDELPDTEASAVPYLQAVMQFLASRQVNRLISDSPNGDAVQRNDGVGALAGLFDANITVASVADNGIPVQAATTASLSADEAALIYADLDALRTFLHDFVDTLPTTVTAATPYIGGLRPLARRAVGNQPPAYLFSSREVDYLLQAAPNLATALLDATPLTNRNQAPSANLTTVPLDGSYRVVALSDDNTRTLFRDLSVLRGELASSRAGSSGFAPDLASQLGAVLAEAFFLELEQNTVGNLRGQFDDFVRGYSAIETVFPSGEQTRREGSLSMLLSRIHTEDGGDINVFVPGGSANTGAASTSSLTKPEDRLGIVAQGSGDVHGFVRDDFLVNASRVFALNGGDIIMWASSGDLDAGRGAKTALAAPPPQVVFDPSTGQFVTVFPPEVSGSGIRNFAQPGVSPGDVVLSAPVGVIDAGDAGIGSEGNIFLVAETIRNNTNISTTSGQVVTSEAPPVLATSFTQASSSSSAASNDGEGSGAEEASKAAAAAANAFEQPTLSIISVEVIGFGG